jgi:hypothetical protein
MILDWKRLSRIDEGQGGELRSLYRLGLRLLGGRRTRRSVPLGVIVLGSAISFVSRYCGELVGRIELTIWTSFLVVSSFSATSDQGFCSKKVVSIFLLISPLFEYD